MGFLPEWREQACLLRPVIGSVAIEKLIKGRDGFSLSFNGLSQQTVTWSFAQTHAVQWRDTESRVRHPRFYQYIFVHTHLHVRQQ